MAAENGFTNREIQITVAKTRRELAEPNNF
jgi:hypothetical protein